MAVLEKTDLTGVVEEILFCRDSVASIVSEDASVNAEGETGEVFVSLEGLPGDTHAGLTRPSCVRVKELYPEGTEIRNTRQITVVSQEEMATIADKLGIDTLPPAWLGANLMLSGIPHLTLLPPSSRLQFSSGLTLVVDLENMPCIFPARVIDEYHPGKGSKFVTKAKHLRGFTAWVERPGTVKPGDTVAVHVPGQAPYPHR